MSKDIRYTIGTAPADPWDIRNAMVWGVDKPLPSLVGAVWDGVVRTQLNGKQTLSTPGNQTFRNVDIFGQVDVKSPGTKLFKNCRLYGDPTGNNTSYGLITCTDSSVTDVVIEDCQLTPSNPSQYVCGVQGHHFTVRRSVITNCVDAIDIFNSNAPTADLGVLIEMNFMGWLSWFYPDASHTDGSHCDVIQLFGGSGAVIRGNYMYGYNSKAVGNSPYTYLTTANGFTDDTTNPRSLSCIMITPTVGAVTNMTVTKNWLDGGQISVNAGANANAGNYLGMFSYNRFGRDQYYQGAGGNDTHTLDFDPGCTYTAVSNVYDSDGAAVRVRTNA